MFTINVGTVDRILRLVVGVALLAWFFFDRGAGFWHYAKLIGIVPIVTAALGTCPIYSLLGISTCPTRRT